MRGLITLVNDNHVDNYLKENLAFLYYDSTVNNRPKICNFLSSVGDWIHLADLPHFIQ